MASTRPSALPAFNSFPISAAPLSTGQGQLSEHPKAHGISSTPGGLDEYAVKEQLARILGSLFFRNSARYTGLLQYVVDTALCGDQALMKERLIGINVFGRDPSYDTVKDNVVRMAAAEVRGRLVRYYALPEHRDELRIILSPGSYVPRFASAETTQQQHGPLENENLTLIKFWKPLIECLDPILIVLGSSQSLNKNRTLHTNATDSYRKFSEKITLSDALTLAKIVSFIESCGKAYRVEMQDFVRFRDLRNSPAILLGGLNNQWTLSFAEHLRFAFKLNRGRTKTWIHDKETPSRQKWTQNLSLPLPAITEDHAIVARLRQSVTGHAVVIAGGHTPYGTAAAGEFVTSNSHLASVSAGLSHDWVLANLELVIATNVVQGVSGPPRIRATYAW